MKKYTISQTSGGKKQPPKSKRSPKPPAKEQFTDYFPSGPHRGLPQPKKPLLGRP